MWALFFINAVSIFGYATFTLHPQLLARYPWSLPIYAVSYPLFARLQILIGFWLCVRACHKAIGWRWPVYFGSAFLISFAMEFSGTSFGIPFGKYSYTGLMGWQLFDKVPLLIPVSWFCMSLCCYLLAVQFTGPIKRNAFPGARRWQGPVQRVGLAAVLLIAWDFTLEPAMSQLTPYWIWEEAGVFFFGVAVRNLLGWLVTGLLIFTSFEILRLRSYSDRFQSSWPLKFYLLNLFLPIGLSLAGSVWPPVILTAVVLSSCFLYATRRGTLKAAGVVIRGSTA